jgi:hypothetical protein
MGWCVCNLLIVVVPHIPLSYVSSFQVKLLGVILGLTFLFWCTLHKNVLGTLAEMSNNLLMFGCIELLWILPEPPRVRCQHQVPAEVGWIQGLCPSLTYNSLLARAWPRAWPHKTLPCELAL